MSDSPVIDEITPDELYQDIRRGSRPFILDVRNEEEFANWAIEGLPPNPAQHPLLCVPRGRGGMP